MNTLAATIKSTNLTGTADEIVATLDALVSVTPTNTNWSYKGLAIRFGHETVGTIDETLKAIPGMDWVRLSLASTDGLDFAAAETQTGLVALRDGGALSADVAAALMSLGVESHKRWVMLGLESLPTADDVQVALNQIESVEWITNVLEPRVAHLKAGGGDLSATKATILALVQ